MITEKATSKALMASVLIGFALIVVGELVKIAGNGDSMLWFGILFLIISPLIAVIAAMLSFILGKEWDWAIVTISLVIISIIGIILAYIV